MSHKVSFFILKFCLPRALIWLQLSVRTVSDGQLQWSVAMVRYDGKLQWSATMVSYEGQLQWSITMARSSQLVVNSNAIGKSQ